MFYSGGFLNAVVDEGLVSVSSGYTITSPSTDYYDSDRKSTSGNTTTSSIGDVSSLSDDVNDSNLSNRQRQKLKRKLKKQEAIKRKRLLKTGNHDTAKAQSCISSSTSHQPLRLHQFISIVFRSELNIAENGVGYFIQNAPKVSAHHAILNGVVRVNGLVTKTGSKILHFGDLVSLEVDTSPLSEQHSKKLISWKGSEQVAKKVEGERDYGAQRKGRMTTSLPASSSSYPAAVDSNIISTLPFIQYYRTKLGRLWLPSIHEKAIMTPLPMTLRVLKNNKHLEAELRGFGFRPVKESDVSFQLCHTSNVTVGNQHHQNRPVDFNIMKEFMSNTWIMDQNQAAREGELGVFLSEARTSSEILQQELNSMMPVSILVSILKGGERAKEKSCHNSSISVMKFLDLCAAPGSKTCQLIHALDTILNEHDGDEMQKRYSDFVIVANELNPSRAMKLRQRCFQQCGSRALSHLLITNVDGCAFENVEKGGFDFVICDVPCSGDGTIRRSPDLLYKWSTKNAEKNKPIQKDLLKVALERLRPGGVCVYSTCSLNPVENDEVVEETLYELNKNNDDEYSLLNLERNCGGNCGSYLRILPAACHGGFFVAAIRRKESDLDDERSNKISHGECGVEMVWKNKEAANSSVAYAISPCTRLFSAHISETLDSPISCGVPVMWKEKNESAPTFLQEGCAAMVGMGHEYEFMSVVQLSRLQLGECVRCADGRTLSIPKNFFPRIKKETTALIVHVNADSTRSQQRALFLPAKILHKQKRGDVGNIDVSYEVVEIIARPQIFKRSLCGN